MSIKYRLQEFRRGLGPAKKELLFTLRRIKKSPLSIVGLVIITFYVMIAILAPVIAPPVNPDPFRIWRDGFSAIPKPPGTPVTDDVALRAGWTVHYFGVAEGGYDIFYGCIWGTITAFRVGAMVVLIALIIGILLGCLAGYYGGIIDEILMRFTDIILAFPGLILAMALVIALPPIWALDIGLIALAFLIFLIHLIACYILKIRKVMLVSLISLIGFLAIYIWALNSPSIAIIALDVSQLDKVLIALAIVGWPGYTRVIRAEILRVKQEDYVEAAKAIGCSDSRIIIKHIIPNAIYPIIIMASLDIGSIVLTAAALSFLGIGAPPGYADWGQMISFARNWIWAGFQNPWEYWYTFTIPGIFIFTFVLGWNLLGDAFRDILDPTLRRR
ncbi:MAG: ABC transporter permease [Candidatus Freyarchaeota archaeon]|nr:ABC transporter permease [Candidatus Jordarchaeia archaeon]